MEIVVFSPLFKLKDIKTMKLYCSSHEDVIARIGELLSLIIYFELVIELTLNEPLSCMANDTQLIGIIILDLILGIIQRWNSF